MVRRFLKMAAAASVAATAVASVPSCADNHESIFVAGVLALTYPACTATPDPTATLLAGGIMELKLTNQYQAWLLVGSQLLALGQPATSAAESNRVQMSGADIQLNDSSGNQIAYYSVAAYGILNPTLTSDPSYGAISVQLIPPAAAATIAGQVAALEKANKGNSVSVSAVIKVYGQTLGLTNVESGPFTYPITITDGGTIVKTVNSAKAVDCTSIPTNVTFTTPCFSGQDVLQNPCFYVCSANPNDPVCK